MPRVEGKTVLVTGAASGIGAATARLLAREGASVMLADLDAARGSQLAADIGADAAFMALDVTDEAAWRAAVDGTVRRFGGLHGLVNAAGVGRAANVEDCSLEEWRLVNRVNSTGTFLGCREAVRAMKREGDTTGRAGSIVNISSVLGLRGLGEAAAYSASKGAVRLLTKHVALHCARMRLGVRCNSVHPGYIDTPMIRRRLDATIDGIGGREWLEERHPIGRLGTAEEIAALILFLVSDESSFCTGAEFVADGGLTA